VLSQKKKIQKKENLSRASCPSSHHRARAHRVNYWSGRVFNIMSQHAQHLQVYWLSGKFRHENVIEIYWTTQSSLTVTHPSAEVSIELLQNISYAQHTMISSCLKPGGVERGYVTGKFSRLSLILADLICAYSR
jgi:hypothetical protein